MKTIVIIYGDSATHSEASCIKLNYYEMQNQRKKKSNHTMIHLPNPFIAFLRTLASFSALKLLAGFKVG